MKKILCLGLFTFIVFNLVGTSAVFAQEAGTLIPETTLSKTECDKILYDAEVFNFSDKDKNKTNGITVNTPREYFVAQNAKVRNDTLACAVITGKIKFWMVPFYIVYLIEFAIGISGLVAILFLIVGGFQYVVGSTESDDKAKNTIKYALMGLVVVLVAWVLVNLLQFMLTI